MRLRTTRMLQPFFPGVLWRGEDSSVYLTFDDGPHPVATPEVLRILRKRGLRASFFLLGTEATKHPELVRSIHEEGHTVGNHSFEHAPMLFRSSQALKDQIERTADLLASMTGVRTRLFRPPYGYFGPALLRAARSANHRLVLWDVDSADFLDRPPLSAAQRSSAVTRPGSIVLFHDNESTKNRIGSILTGYLDALQARNLACSPLPS